MKKEDEQALEVYRTYVALKAHFSNSGGYDYFKEEGRIRANWVSFQKRNDKGFFYTLSRKKDWFNWLLANIVYDDGWIGDIVVNDHAEENYKQFRKVRESLTYNLKQAMIKLGTFRDAIEISDREHPQLIKMHLSGEISPEAFSIIAVLTRAWGYWDQYLDDIIYETLKRKATKYYRFIGYSDTHWRLVLKWKNTNNTVNIENTENTLNVIR